MKITNAYIQGLVRKYIDKSITDEERHALEKIALDDAMLFDMLEGLSYSDNNKAESSVNELENINELAAKINKPAAKKSRKLYPWISIAASLLFILVSAIIIKNNIPSDYNAAQESGSDKTLANRIENPEMGQNETIITTENDEVEFSPSRADELVQESGTQDNREIDIVQEQNNKLGENKVKLEKANSSSKKSTDNEIQTKGSRAQSTDYHVDGVSVTQGEPEKDIAENQKSQDSRKAKRRKEEAPSTSADMIPNNSQIVENQKDTRSYAEKRTAVKASDVPTDVIEEELADLSLSKKDMPPESPGIEGIENSKEVEIQITGSVSDENGVPLIGASVFVSGTSRGTITDIDGLFTLIVRKEDLSLSVSYTGYDTEEIYIDDRSELDLTLSQGTVLDEIVVVQNVPNVQTLPVMGFDFFSDYIEENMVVPDGCNSSKPTVLDFKINVDGSVSEIIIKESAGELCDAEAQRLLRNAGKWKTIPPKREYRAQYKFYIR